MLKLGIGSGCRNFAKSETRHSRNGGKHNPRPSTERGERRFDNKSGEARQKALEVYGA